MHLAQPYLEAVARQYVDYRALALRVAHQQPLARLYGRFGFAGGGLRGIGLLGRHVQGMLRVVEAEAVLNAVRLGYRHRACGRKRVYLQIAVAELHARGYAARRGLRALPLEVYLGTQLFVDYAAL